MKQNPFLAAMALRPGSLRLLALRLAALLGLSIPAFVVTRADLELRLGADPRLDPSQHLDAVTVMRLFFEGLPATLSLAIVFLLVGFWLFDQALTSGALVVLARRETRVRVWWAIWQCGWPHVGAFLRLAVGTFVLAMIGLWFVSHLLSRLSRAAEAGAWGAAWQFVFLPALAAILVWIWLALVGTFGLWGRVLIVADRRRRVRRVAFLLLRLFKRAPGRALFLFAAIELLVQGLGALMLLWPLPARGGSFAGALPWALYLLLRTYVWLWLLQAARLLSAEERFVDLRAAPDEPLGIWVWLTGLVKKPSVELTETSNSPERC